MTTTVMACRILRMLPVIGPLPTAAIIRSRLASEGHDLSLRQVQRYLSALETGGVARRAKTCTPCRWARTVSP